MRSPLEIVQQNFKTAVSGYNKKEVDEFLYELRHDYEELYNQVATLKEEKKYTPINFE